MALILDFRDLNKFPIRPKIQMKKTTNESSHHTIQSLSSRLDRYDLDWSHRHYKQEPLFIHKGHPNPEIKLGATPYIVKPSEPMQQFHIRGVPSMEVFPKGLFSDRNYQHPMTHSTGRKQVFVYQTDPIQDNELDPKWRRDYRDRYFDFTKNFELETYADTSKKENSSKFFPHLNKYHSTADGVRHPKFYDSDFRYFPYQKNFLAMDKQRVKKVDYLETVKKIREELKLTRGMYFDEPEKPLEEVMAHDPQFSNALVQGDKDFYLAFIAFVQQVIEEIEVLEKFQEIISLSDCLDCDLIYDSFYENLENEGKKIDRLDLGVLVEDIIKPLMKQDEAELVILDEDYRFFQNLSTAFHLDSDKITRFQLRRFVLGDKQCSNVVRKSEIDKENLEIFTTVVKIYFSILKKLKYCSRVLFKKSSGILKSLELAFPYQNQRILERDFHAWMYSKKVKCRFESSCFLFSLLDIDRNGYIQAVDFYNLIKLFN